MKPLLTEVDESSFKSEVFEASLLAPVLLVFYAGWCRNCLKISPHLEELNAEKKTR